MKIYVNVIKIVLLFVITLTFTSCGYRPSAKFVRVVVGEKISTNVKISAKDPENTVLIKDAVDSAIIEVFHSSLTTKKLSTTHLEIEIAETVYSPLQYDREGYVVGYRANILLKIARITKNLQKNYVSRGTYDFSVVANAVITDQERFDAIRLSSVKAIKSFIAQLSVEGLRTK